MPVGYAPSVFISSTCYDLSQVRFDLKTSIETLGLDPIVSESFAFPVNPGANTIENCLRAVRDRADIFVLIVGNRYGFQTDTGKSVTNLEYLEAKAKGIPIYVFVLDKILSILSVWRKNKEGDYSDVVDTTKLFEFVDEVRAANDHWVFPFQTASDIAATLKTQLAYLFMDALLIREKARDVRLQPLLKQLTGKSLRIAMERTFGWEYLLFASILQEEFEKNAALKWDLKYAVKSGAVTSFSKRQPKEDVLEMIEWTQRKAASIGSLVDSTSALINVAIKEAVGKPGEPGDPQHIAYVATRLALAYRRLLEWSIDFNDVVVRPECQRLIQILSTFSADVIGNLESMPSKIETEIGKAAASQGVYKANLMFVLAAPPADEFEEEIDKLASWMHENY